MMIRSAPTLILTATIDKTSADGAVVGSAAIAGCGVGVGVTEEVAEGVSREPYPVRVPGAMNGSAVGNPSGAQAGKRS